MAKVDIQIVLPQSKNELEALFNKEIAQELQKRILAKITPIKNQIRNLIPIYLKSSPTYQSLLNGELKDLFCLPDSFLVLTEIESAIALEIVPQIQNVSAGQKVKGSFSFSFLRSDYQKISQLGTYSTINGRDVFWMDWLLYSGNSSVGRFNLVQTRNGVLMRPSNENFSVPNEHAGTQGDNFLTRAFKGIDKDIEKICSKEL